MSFASSVHDSDPPCYLLTQPRAISSSHPHAPASFAHPLIEYHFADDQPSALLPSSDAESVIILDYDDPISSPLAHSLHKDLAVGRVKVTPAPGATAALPARDGDLKRNDKMYIIETLSAAAGDAATGESHYDLDNPQLLLSQFRERNALLRKVLDQPSTKSANPLLDPEAPPSMDA